MKWWSAVARTHNSQGAARSGSVNIVASAIADALGRARRFGGHRPDGLIGRVGIRAVVFDGERHVFVTADQARAHFANLVVVAALLRRAPGAGELQRAAGLQEDA